LQIAVWVVCTPNANERDAFRAIFSFGGSLADLDPTQVRNITAAVANARTFAREVIVLLRR
jgi:chromosome partitioning protein